MKQDLPPQFVLELSEPDRDIAIEFFQEVAESIHELDKHMDLENKRILLDSILSEPSLNPDVLVENEHKLISPDLIGTDQEKIAGIRFWADIVGMLRSLTITVNSFDNKQNLINAIRHELEIINIELNNISSTEVRSDDGSVSLEQVPPSGDKSSSLNAPATTESDIEKKLRAEEEKRQASLDQLRRAAGIFGSPPKLYV